MMKNSQMFGEMMMVVDLIVVIETNPRVKMIAGILLNDRLAENVVMYTDHQVIETVAIDTDHQVETIVKDTDLRVVETVYMDQVESIVIVQIEMMTALVIIQTIKEEEWVTITRTLLDHHDAKNFQAVKILKIIPLPIHRKHIK
jgi:hypothetical protein